VGLGNLPLHLGLRTFVVKGWAERTGVRRLQPVVSDYADIPAILIVKNVVDSRGP
jgi:hypothetical protein